MDIERVKKFLTETHEQIEGWFFPLDQLVFYELMAVQDNLNIDGDIAEIGVYHGKSLVLLSLLKSAAQRLLGFDLFDEDHQPITEKNLLNFGLDTNVILRKGLTSDISADDLEALMPRALRFLHIDAGHEYHEVLEQLELFSPFVGDQGIIAMDDYQDREFPGIEAAVLDFANRDRPRRFVPFLAGGNKMFVCPSHLAAMLQRIILARPNFMDRCRLTRVRDFNILVLNSKLPVTSEKIMEQIAQLGFPQRLDTHPSLKEASSAFSQLAFGSGATHAEN